MFPTHPSSRRFFGFTLIELLVVVAVIAILAAIAVPNFLEAQIRSKVSRAKADMRTLVTAIESYAVDHNRYPTYHYVGTALEFFVGGEVTDFGISPVFDGRNPLTTPIAYISSPPGDPFFAGIWGPTPELREYHYVSWRYAVESVSDEARKQQFREAETIYGSYRIHSRGPDIEGPDRISYDPTNGSTSRGDVLYGPNIGFLNTHDF